MLRCLPLRSDAADESSNRSAIPTVDATYLAYLKVPKIHHNDVYQPELEVYSKVSASNIIQLHLLEGLVREELDIGISHP